ncbi:MAG: serine/threonine-protein phosphatase [Pyrinomonadaceae bacterium]|nr:serine/threonine-protein phosphatase [Phycisphaerales bacterium]
MRQLIGLFHMATLVVIGSEHQPVAAKRCLDRFGGYCAAQAGSVPSIEYQTLEAVKQMPPDEAGEWDAALICVSTQVADSLLYQVVSLLDEAMVPALALDGSGGTIHRDGMSTDCIFLNASDESDAAPAMLYALLRRQRSFKLITEGLQAAKSFQCEASAEIDRLHDELLLAAKVQREFLPKQLPALPGLSVGVIFRPAGFVSGDIYDVNRLDEDHIGFFLADAMGHGVPAALMTLFISGSLPQKEIEGTSHRVIPPSESLSRLNSNMCASRGGSSRFATAVCGVINTRTRMVTLSSAGHPPALRVSNGQCVAVELSGPLLGVFDDAEFDQTTFQMSEDELLLLHSDGVEEAYAPRQLAAPSNGEIETRHIESIGRLTSRRAGEGASDAVARLADDLDSQAGSFHQSDDVTVLAFGLM